MTQGHIRLARPFKLGKFPRKLDSHSENLESLLLFLVDGLESGQRRDELGRGQRSLGQLGHAPLSGCGGKAHHNYMLTRLFSHLAPESGTGFSL